MKNWTGEQLIVANYCLESGTEKHEFDYWSVVTLVKCLAVSSVISVSSLLILDNLLEIRFYYFDILLIINIVVSSYYD